MSEDIKIDDANIAELQQYWVPLVDLRRKLLKLKKEGEFLLAQQNASRALLWKRIEELYPKTEEGNWHINTDEWILSSSNNSGPPPELSDLLKGLLG